VTFIAERGACLARFPQRSTHNSYREAPLMVSLSLTVLAASLIMAPTGNARAHVADSTRVNKYLSYNSGTKTAYITLIAAATSVNGGLNFNGGSKGDQTITVPAGWTVHINFQNHDIIPHSAIVIRNQSPVPVTPSKPAFPVAFTTHLSDGLPAQTGHDTIQFKASSAGQYLIACGVPGHAVTGMYVNFVVSPTASAPTNTGTIGPP
jgi:sulfocyanin